MVSTLKIYEILEQAKIEDKPAQPSADPLGALAKSKAGASEPPQIAFFVQVGALPIPHPGQGGVE